MKHIKKFDEINELRRDRMTSYGPGHKDRKLGVKGFKGTKDYKEVRHQSNKADRQKAKIDIKKGKVFEDKISFRPVSENEDSKSHDFLKDIENIKRMAEEILMMDPDEVDLALSQKECDQIKESKDVIKEVYDFLWSD